jgi:hypothetical protein
MAALPKCEAVDSSGGRRSSPGIFIPFVNSMQYILGRRCIYRIRVGRVWTNRVRQNRLERFWTHAVRPQGEGQDGPRQSHPLFVGKSVS